VRRFLLPVVLAACTPGAAELPDAAGQEVDASPPDVPDAAPPGPPGEMRGLWVTRFAWTTQAELEGIIDRAAAAHFNAVFVQIRGQGDAYYDSNLEPWAQRLTGVLGRDPGWDPLQVAIDRAHAHGLQLHAYFNVLSAWNAGEVPPVAEGAAQHALRAHPDWLAVTSSGQNGDGEYQWFTPGNPAVRAHIAAVARDLLARYDVDGLHLDRIRTPGPDYSHDAVTQAAFDADPSLGWDGFMREQVNQMVADLHQAVAETRPTARLSAAVWGIYTPLPGCSTSQGYGQYYQDSRAWLLRGTMDALVPMIYWPIEPGACTDWSTLLAGFLEARAGGAIWAGMHALDDSAWVFPAVRARIEHARVAGAEGTVIFASTYLDADPARWDELVGSEAAPGPFFEPAPPP
jgi:uncharacterized lipoprotein YddW (UPF0748 family)